MIIPYFPKIALPFIWLFFENRCYLLKSFACFPPKVFLLAKSWLWGLPAFPNFKGTTCSKYNIFPGKCLLSLGSIRSCGNQYATYSPSGSYVCACKRYYCHIRDIERDKKHQNPVMCMFVMSPREWSCKILKPIKHKSSCFFSREIHKFFGQNKTWSSRLP